MHAFDRQTDGQTESSSQDRVCIQCSAVKMQPPVPKQNPGFAVSNASRALIGNPLISKTEINLRAMTHVNDVK